MLSALGRQAAAASLPLPFRIYNLGMDVINLKGARPDCASQLGRIDRVDMDQEVTRREHSQRRPAPTSTNMYRFEAGVNCVHIPGRTIKTRFKQHLWCTSNAGFEHFSEDVSFTVGFYRLPRSDSGSNGIDSLPSHFRLTSFDRINMDTDGLCVAVSRLALSYGINLENGGLSGDFRLGLFCGLNMDADGLCTAILDSLWSMKYTRILMVLCYFRLTLLSGIYKDTVGLCTAVLDSPWSMEYHRILMGSV